MLGYWQKVLMRSVAKGDGAARFLTVKAHYAKAMQRLQERDLIVYAGDYYLTDKGRDVWEAHTGEATA